MKENILQHAREKLPQNRAIAAIDFETAGLPPALSHFLLRALNHRIRQEVEAIRFPTTTWLNASGASFKEVLSNLRGGLLDLGQYPSEEVEPYFRRAVDIVVDYLNRPIDTLLDFIFIRDAESTPVSNVKHRTAYFENYPHLLSVVTSSIVAVETSPTLPTDSIAEQELDRASLHDKLLTADRLYTSTLDATGWMNLLHPICDIYAFGSRQSDKVPFSLLNRFIGDRGATDLTEQLTSRVSNEEGLVGLDTLLRRLEEALRPVSAPGIDTSIKTDGAVQSTLPLWKQFATAGNSESADSSDTASSDTAAPLNQPLWKRYTAINSDTHDTRGAMELRVLGPASQLKNAFIRDLFDNDDEAYQTVISALAESRDWNESAEILKKEVFLKYHIDLYSESAIAFTNAVEEHVKQFS